MLFVAQHPHNVEDGGENVAEVDTIIEQNHAWLAEFIKGNVEPAKKMFSHRDDVTLAGPQPTAHREVTAPIARGWHEVAETLDRANLYFREGEVTDFENMATYATDDVAWTVEVERFNAKVAGSDLAPVALRVTSIFRREDGTWKLVHRHADPVIAGQPPESIVQR